MRDFERTSAGFQIVLPGCERRTFPKSTSAADDTGQGLLDFYRLPTCARNSLHLRTRPCSRDDVKGDDGAAPGRWREGGREDALWDSWFRRGSLKAIRRPFGRLLARHSSAGNVS